MDVGGGASIVPSRVTDTLGKVTKRFLPAPCGSKMVVKRSAPGSVSIQVVQ